MSVNFGNELEAGDIKIELNKGLHIKNVSFSYKEASSIALEDIDLKIPAFGSVALVGATGSGKTTLVNIILGLLKPCSGEIWVDDCLLTEQNLKIWQRSIGYVPQQVQLVDDTLAANVAFGVPKDEINMNALVKVCKVAAIDDFINNELTEGYATRIGENGIKLSGGQRQRIGIARALYHDPKVLVFDEATSALDGVTERKVVKNLKHVSRDLTLVQIAHRLTTIKHSDVIYMLKDGKIEDSGTFDQLADRNPDLMSVPKV